MTRKYHLEFQSITVRSLKQEGMTQRIVPRKQKGVFELLVKQL